MALSSYSLQRDKFLCNVKTPRHKLRKKKKKKNIHLKIEYSKNTLCIHGIKEILSNIYIIKDCITYDIYLHIFFFLSK